MKRYVWPVVVAGLACGFIGPLHAQRGAGGRRSGTAPVAAPVPAAPVPPAPAPTSATAVPPQSATEPASYIEDRELMVRRDQIDAAARQVSPGPSKGAAEPKSKGLIGGFGNRFKDALNGDESREEAARGIVRSQAAAESANGAKTVVVVIGSQSDRDKVKESLADVKRQVVVLYVNDSFKDETYDNSALRSGIKDKVGGAATNLWVFLPRPGASSTREPDRTLSTKIVSAKVWTGLFISDGDLPTPVANLANGQKPVKSSAAASAPAAAAAPAAPSAPAAVAGFGEGDVVGPKIANVKLLAQPADDGRVLATLAKTDELVVIGAEKNGYLNVQGASAAGWVKVVLVTKR